MKFTVLSFLVAFMAGLLGLTPTNVVQVCCGEMGFEHEQPWRARALTAAMTRCRAFISSVSDTLRAWRAHPFALPAATVAVVLLLQAVAPEYAHAASFAVVGVLNIKQIRQDIADNDRAIAAKKVQLRDLMAATPHDKRTDEEKAKIAAVEGELDSLVAKAADLSAEHSRALKAQEEERQQGSQIQMGRDLAADRPWGSMGEQLCAIARASMPNPVVDPRLMAGPTGASAGEPSTGGFLMHSAYSDRLLARAREESPILGMCTEIPIPEGTESIDLPIIEETSRATGSRWGGVRVYRKAEADTVTASKPKFGQLKVNTSEIMGIAYATDRLLRNARTIEAVFANAFSSEFAFKVTDELIRGGGGDELLGVLNATAVRVKQTKETSQAAATVKVENLSKMWSRVASRSKARGVWVINNDVEPELDFLAKQYTAGTDGIAVLPPNFVTYGPDGALRIKGRPVLRLEQCSTLGTEGDIMFIDPTEYLLCPQGGIQGDSSMHVRFIYGEMTFRWTYYINGRPAWVSALTPYKGSATVSPFVTLETRS